MPITEIAATLLFFMLFLVLSQLSVSILRNGYFVLAFMVCILHGNCFPNGSELFPFC